ncbi:hypothetical protein RST01_16610 [Rummeliibacillus stabekisii]|nr:hypothetical protein RST01_16610 [Rummeliibacillus stabekisii]
MVAFDYSEQMVESAKNRSENYLNQIDYRVVDATNYDELFRLVIKSMIVQ